MNAHLAEQTKEFMYDIHLLPVILLTSNSIFTRPLLVHKIELQFDCDGFSNGDP